MPETIPLRDVVRALRTDIMAAVEEASTHSIKFGLGQIELEFQVVAKSEKSADGKVGGKINFHIFSADASVGGGGRLADERTQKVKFVLTPIVVDATGKRASELLISRRNKKPAGS